MEIYFVILNFILQYRSPSPPPMDYQRYEPQLPPTMSMPLPPRQRGLTTVTTLVISNLNDTVSHNDVHVSYFMLSIVLKSLMFSHPFIQELCTAIGPVDTVVMTAPGVAEVTYRYKDDALEAFKKYNQRNLDGKSCMM